MCLFIASSYVNLPVCRTQPVFPAFEHWKRRPDKTDHFGTNKLYFYTVQCQLYSLNCKCQLQTKDLIMRVMQPMIKHKRKCCKATSGPFYHQQWLSERCARHGKEAARLWAVIPRVKTCDWQRYIRNYRAIAPPTHRPMPRNFSLSAQTKRPRHCLED